MTDNEYRGIIEDIIHDGQEAVGNGSAALEETNKAIAHTRLVIDELQAARTFALQKLGNMNMLIQRMEMVLRGTMSVDALEAQQHFVASQKHIQNYANRIALAIDAQKKFLNILTMNRRDAELSASGAALYQGVTSLERYITGI